MTTLNENSTLKDIDDALGGDLSKSIPDFMMDVTLEELGVIKEHGAFNGDFSGAMWFNEALEALKEEDSVILQLLEDYGYTLDTMFDVSKVPSSWGEMACTLVGFAAEAVAHDLYDEIKDAVDNFNEEDEEDY